MTKLDAYRFLACLAVLAALALTPAMAQNDGAQSEDSPGFVYTTEYLQKRLAAAERETTVVYTNRDLDERAEAGAAPPTAFTNDDLQERFGTEEGEADATNAGEADAAAEPAGEDATPAAEATEEPAEPSMSLEERNLLVSEIDGELKRLEKRLLAIRNPLLAGTVPPTEEERAEEAGLDNEERLLRTEDKIDDLKKALEQLRKQDG